MKISEVKISEPVDEIIEKIVAHTKNLQELREKASDEHKKTLLGTLRNIFQYIPISLVAFSCKELQGISAIQYKTKSGNAIELPIVWDFIEKVNRRSSLLDAWGQFEIYFSAKVPNSGRISTKRMIDIYYGGKTPPLIDFFRESRNCTHDNGFHNIGKSNMSCLINGTEYTLQAGKQVHNFSFEFLVDITDEALKLL